MKGLEHFIILEDDLVKLISSCSIHNTTFGILLFSY